MGSLTSFVPQLRGRVTNAAWLILCGMIAGCGLQAPDTGYAPSAQARAAAFPALLPQPQVESAMAPAPPAADLGPLAGRAEALRARAQSLSAPVLDPAARARLQSAGGAG
ncbi:hypothetical protein GE300_01795 [Rhodobacteraceae bacterium 2CG4]|uniref:Uncharacterized protein n=1 Tax=Halovulum marinum TaxID=2662447 RepID=A0A6L5YVS6_9RHOB|nr:hypothetical protein [Halovulum marinum]MSU88348.1 hypothetical protein [Halovulum marinum]